MVKKKELSRQRLWQLKKVESGLCYLCGKFRIYRNMMCISCWRKNRDYKLRYRVLHGQKTQRKKEVI